MREQRVCDCAESVDVAPACRVAPAEALGRGEGKREPRGVVSRCRAVDRGAPPVTEDERGHPVADHSEDVPRFHVPVIEVAFVSGADRLADVPNDRQSTT